MSGLAQKGFSLIELVLVLALSSLLILGMTQLYLDIRRLHQEQQAASRDLDTARFTLQSLEAILRKAGYRQNPVPPLPHDFPALSVGECHFTAGEFIRHVADDVLCLRYQARHPQERDCEGNVIAEQAGAVPGRIERLQYDRGNASLYCRAVAAGSALTGKGAALVEGIASLHFDVSTSVHPVGGAMAFIRYSMLLEGHHNLLPRQPEAHEFWCREWRVSAHGVCGERAAKQPVAQMFFSRSVAIRRSEP